MPEETTLLDVWSELHGRVRSVNFPLKLCEVKGQVYLAKTFLQSFQPHVDKGGGHPCLLAQIKHLNPPSEKLHTHLFLALTKIFIVTPCKIILMA